MVTLDDRDAVEPTIGLPVEEVDERGPDDARFWSVTEILDTISKGEGLMVWGGRKAADAALDEGEHIAHLLETEGRQAARDYIANARRRPADDRLTDANLGSAFHVLAEQWSLTGTRPDCADTEALVASFNPDLTRDGIEAEGALLCTFLDHYGAWLDRFQPEILAAEFVVYNTRYRYAGTCDGAMRLPEGPDNDPVVVNHDFKTTREAFTGGKQPKPKTPYTETVLQLVAYRRAEFAAGFVPRRFKGRRYYLMSQGERALAIPMATLGIEGSVCILVTPLGCEAFPMRTDQAAFNAFLYVLEVARWKLQTSKGAVGKPLAPPPVRGEES